MPKSEQRVYLIEKTLADTDEEIIGAILIGLPEVEVTTVMVLKIDKVFTNRQRLADLIRHHRGHGHGLIHVIEEDVPSEFLEVAKATGVPFGIVSKINDTWVSRIHTANGVDVGTLAVALS